MKAGCELHTLVLSAGEQRSVQAGEYETILLVQSGRGQAAWQQGRAALHTETVLLLRPGSKAELTAPAGAGMELKECRLLPQQLARLSDESCDLAASFSVVPFRCAAVRLGAQDATLIKRMFTLLEREQKDPDAFANTVCQRGLLELLVVWVLRACIAEERKTALVGRRRLVVDEVFAYVNAHLESPLRLKDLAARFYVSPEHLARQFKARTGQTLHQYITKARLSRCRALVCDGLPLAAIWSRCGFSSYGAMLRSFKQEFGVSPAEYYRQCCQKAREYPRQAQPNGPKHTE